eukprot:jgi/Chlat1/312/Chrsp1S03065
MGEVEVRGEVVQKQEEVVAEWWFGRAAVKPAVLTLRTAFGTSHSSSHTRTNAAVTLTVADTEGYGEAGLPPKKPGVYEADYADVHAFFTAWAATVTQQQASPSCAASLKPDPFAELPVGYFASLQYYNIDDADDDGQSCGASQEETKNEGAVLLNRVFRLLLRALDTNALAREPFAPACKSAIETAILDCLARHRQCRGEPLYRTLGLTLPSTPLCRSFYTAAMHPDIAVTVANAHAFRTHTPLTKVKVDIDIERALAVVAAIVGLDKNAVVHDGDEVLRRISVDANAAWTPSLALRFLEALGPLEKHILAIEQPFPADLMWEPLSTNASHVGQQKGEAYHLDAWRAVQRAYKSAGVLVIADESMRTAADVFALAPVVHGVNIKLEKAGGYRAALAAIDAARGADLRVWIGVMVGSVVNSTAAAQLLPLADYCDLDGSLLVTEDSQEFEGGFIWNTAEAAGVWDVVAGSPVSTKYGHVMLAEGLGGLGVRRKSEHAVRAR